MMIHPKVVAGLTDFPGLPEAAECSQEFIELILAPLQKNQNPFTGPPEQVAKAVDALLAVEPDKRRELIAKCNPLLSFLSNKTRPERSADATIIENARRGIWHNIPLINQANRDEITKNLADLFGRLGFEKISKYSESMRRQMLDLLSSSTAQSPAINVDELKQRLNPPLPEECYAPKISPDGQYAVFQSMNYNGKVWVYKLDSGEEVTNITTPEDCYAPTISPDGQFAVFRSKYDNKKVWIYRISDGGQVAHFTTPEHCYLSSISPDGRYAVFESSKSEQVYIYETSAWKIVDSFNADEVT